MTEAQFVTVREAARIARVSERTIKRWIVKGAVRAVRPSAVARRLLIPRVDVDPARRMPTD